MNKFHFIFQVYALNEVQYILTLKSKEKRTLNLVAFNFLLIFSNQMSKEKCFYSIDITSRCIAVSRYLQCRSGVAGTFLTAYLLTICFAINEKL